MSTALDAGYCKFETPDRIAATVPLRHYLACQCRNSPDLQEIAMRPADNTAKHIYFSPRGQSACLLSWRVLSALTVMRDTSGCARAMQSGTAIGFDAPGARAYHGFMVVTAIL